MRSMARLPDGSDQTLVEVKAVDGAYPLYGSLITEPALDLDPLLAPSGEIHGAAAAPLLLQRLGLQTGDILHLGSGRFEIRAEIRNEPDLISDGFGLAPRLLISLDGLRESGLVQPGSLIEHRYKIRLKDGSDATLARLAEEARATFPEAGWSIRTRTSAAPALANNVERFSQFLTLVGLTALVVAASASPMPLAHLDRSAASLLLKCPALWWAGLCDYLVDPADCAIGIAISPRDSHAYAAQSLLSGFVPRSRPQVCFLRPCRRGHLRRSGDARLAAAGRARDVPAADLSARPDPNFAAETCPCRRRAMIVSCWQHLPSCPRVKTGRDCLYRRGGVLLFIRALSRRWCRLSGHFPSAPWTRCARPRQYSPPGALTPSVVLALGLGLTPLVTLALIDGDLRR